MSRCGYHDDGSNWDLIKWRGQVASAIRGKRGQAFLRELLEALDAMPEKRLITGELKSAEGVCALGSVGVKRGIDMDALDSRDHLTLSDVFGIARQLIQEIEWENDEAAWSLAPEERWRYIRDWVANNLK